MPSGVLSKLSGTKLASVGMKYGIMKREKLVLHNIKKWRMLAY